MGVKVPEFAASNVAAEAGCVRVSEQVLFIEPLPVAFR